jgi:hypothetical protein
MPSLRGPAKSAKSAVDFGEIFGSMGLIGIMWIYVLMILRQSKKMDP